MIEACWCRHPEVAHDEQGCKPCRGAHIQLLQWRHRFRTIESLPPIVTVQPRLR